MATIFKEPWSASRISVAIEVLPLPEAPATPTMTGTLLRGVIEADDGGEPVTLLVKEVDLAIAREPMRSGSGDDADGALLLVTEDKGNAGRLRKLAPPRGAVSSATTTNGREDDAERPEYAAEASAEAAAPATKTDAVTNAFRGKSFDIVVRLIVFLRIT